MPTGYTAAIADGITFQQYALTCARAFGALIEMRDEPMDAAIPDEFKPSTYHAEAVAVATAQLAKVKDMTPEQARLEADREFAAACAAYDKRIADRDALRTKYNDMLAKVQAWQAPTPEHAEYKKFMADQIQQSIDFDCSDSYDSAPECKSTDGWIAIAQAQAERDIRYHTEKHAEEVARAASRTAWVKALRDSLKKVD